ncbi:hypothetical protein [Bradyrhizobium sp.]|uniref:hypothetical protein n=1 Tax=Bradyrhizobium sp. TaxID=376 RepID=UPI003C43FFA8
MLDCTAARAADYCVSFFYTSLATLAETGGGATGCDNHPSGTAATFDQARAKFEAAWTVFLARRIEADFQGWRDQQAWTAEIHCLLGAAEGRDFIMHARIAVMQALNRNVERVFTDLKDHHWGKRKLARDR